MTAPKAGACEWSHEEADLRDSSRTIDDMTNPPLRYVVLHHTGFGEPHHDVMFESDPGSGLITFRSEGWPLVAGDMLTRLGEHRRVYLDYEGPISNNRGEVRRVASGGCAVHINAEQITIEFCGVCEVVVVLRRIQNDLWSVVEVDS